MIALIITNIILVVVIGAVGVVLLAEMIKDNRPIVIKEAKALREYYEAKLKDANEKTAKAEADCNEYKELYNHELQRNSDRNDIMSEKAELEAAVKCLNNELSSCEDRINDMAQENARLKEKLKALKEPVNKKPAKKSRKNIGAKNEKENQVGSDAAK